MSKISELTEQQETSIDMYREKWRKIAFSTQSIEPEKAPLAVEAVHRKLLRTEEFELYFFDSPLAIGKLEFLSYIYPTANLLNPKKLDNIIRKAGNQLIKSLLRHQFSRCISSPLLNLIGNQMDIQLWHYLYQRFSLRAFDELIYTSIRD